MLVVAIAVGGAIGAVMRYLVGSWALQYWGSGFPYGTLLINVIGSLLIGIIIEKSALDGALRAFLIVGLLGSFTTFATFSLETLHLIEAGALIKAGLYCFLSVFVCVTAAWLGTVIVRAGLGSA